jgi:hypothetical protein
MTGIALSSVAQASQVHGVLTVVKGTVTVKSGKNGSEKPAKAGMKVFPKDTIVTGDDSRAKIVMVDKNEINISPASQIVLENYEFDPAKGKKDVLIDVIYGKVRNKVEQKYDGETSKFQVKTPSAVAGVRGTDFLTSYNKTTDSSKVVTFKGEVAYGLPGPNGSILNPVAVTAGNFSANSGSSPPGQPTAVPKQELAQMEVETKAVDPGKGDPRAPAGSEAERSKDDDKGKGDGQGKNDNNGKGDGQGKNEERKGPKSDGPKGDQASGGGMPGPGAPGGPEMGREPAGMMPGGTGGGMDGGGMFMPGDFAGTDTGVMGPMFPDFNPPPLPPPLPRPGDFKCDFCYETIRDGSTRLIIRVNSGAN